MHVGLQTHTHTHTSLFRFLLQLFISPWHFEACSYLSVSLPPNPYFSYAPLLLHFMHFCLPSFHNSPSDFPSFSILCSESVIKYFIMLLNKVMRSSLLLAPFFPPAPVASQARFFCVLFYLLSACNPGVTRVSLYVSKLIEHLWRRSPTMALVFF